ncbi:MAG TPA: 2-dehydropantoate 2-reductase [Candidatus Thermoplasmatota archaeon]|nr:2-dehydropantoate 2-reductase [Candidatus Thermoplasmatota archaeon]
MTSVVVFGAGAVGSWLGALLHQAGHDVTLVGRHDHVSVVNARGLQVSGRTELLARPRAVTRPEAQPPDVLLVTVKAYDTRRAAQEMRPLVGPRTAVVSVQNGLGNVEALADAFTDRQVFAAVTTHGVTFVEPGHVRHAGTGYFRVGSPFNEHARADALAALLREALPGAEASPRIAGELWAKVVVNAAINPLTAITGLRNGALLEVPALRDLMQRAAEEAVDVARAEGAPLPDDDLVLRARRVAELTAQNKSSMLQDVERGRPTEVDAICGEVVERGLRHGVDAPVNLTLRALVKGIEASTRRG